MNWLKANPEAWPVLTLAGVIALGVLLALSVQDFTYPIVDK